MASDKDILIQKLGQVIDLLKSLKKEDDLTKEDKKTLNIAIQYFGKKYDFKNYSGFKSKLSVLVVDDYINALKKDGEENTEKDKQKKTKPKEQEASIPPELESMVAEYRENQALLQSEEVKSNGPLSVAKQVEMALAHSKIRHLALANKERLEAQGKKFEDPDKAFVSLGLTKTDSKTTALASSYQVIEEVAESYSSLKALSSEARKQVIDEAVELSIIGITNPAVAIESASLLIDKTGLTESDQSSLTKISSGYVRSVHDVVTAKAQHEANLEAQIDENEVSIHLLQKELQISTGKDLEAKQFQLKTLLETNHRLSTKIDNLPHQYEIYLGNLNEQSTDFKKFQKDVEAKLSSSIDLKDDIDRANNKIASLHNNFKSSGVKGHLYSPSDDAHLLEQAIRNHDPGALARHAGHDAEYAAALAKDTGSEQSILLFAKNLTPEKMAEYRQYALDNPNSELGKLFQSNKELFSSVSAQIRKISQSKLGQELSQKATGLGKTFKSVSGFFGKISDKFDKYGKVFSVITNPYGALRWWAGRKAGQLIIKQFGKYLSKETAELLLKNGLKEGLKKLIAKAAAKAVIKIAAKEGTKLALKGVLVTAAQALNAIPGLGLVVGFLIGVAIDIAWWIGEKTIGIIKNLQKRVYGDKVRARDFLAVPIMGIGTLVGGIGSFFAGLGSATVAAAGSAVGIITVGIFVGFFFYITSIAVAPLISTLVQLESSPGSGKANSCANIEGIFVSQRDPAWANILCPTCITGDRCNIGGSGCGSASTTMILKSFGIDEEVTSVWNTMHDNGAYFYYPMSTSGQPIHPIQSCPSSIAGNIRILTENGLYATDIGNNLDEADHFLSNCGLIFTLGQLYDDCPNTETGCGHYLVITGRDGNLITTHDPWSGENYVHNIDGHDNDTFTITSMWAIVPQ